MILRLTVLIQYCSVTDTRHRHPRSHPRKNFLGDVGVSGESARILLRKSVSVSWNASFSQLRTHVSYVSSWQIVESGQIFGLSVGRCTKVRYTLPVYTGRMYMYMYGRIYGPYTARTYRPCWLPVLSQVSL